MKSYQGTMIPPNVGDTIKVAGKISKYSLPYGLRYGNADKVFKVLGIKKYAKQYGVKINGSYDNEWYGCQNFDLIKANEVKNSLTKDLTWMCVVNNAIVSVHASKEDAQEAAVKLIGYDYKKQVVIAQVDSVAKVKKPDVSFV